jgi:phage terminase large subunit-like protein
VGDGKVSGEGSGILQVHPKDFMPLYEPSKRRLTWPNGAIATLYNATEPDQLRGPQHDAAWCEELTKWKYAEETWNQLQFGLRLGEFPRQIITTTPRPIPLLKAILAEAGTHATKGRTEANAANLPPSFLEAVRRKYAGTRLGRQELDAEILDDVPGALWTRAMFDRNRVRAVPEMSRIVVAIDPSGSGGDIEDGADDIGIVVAGKGMDGRGYVLADRTCHLSPAGWAARAIAAYHEFGADCIVAERNYGGAMVEHTIRTADRSVAYREVSASRGTGGKSVRAEPVSLLYEQDRVSHLGALPELEDQMCQMGKDGYLGNGSPDRLDAAVWGISELMVNSPAGLTFASI